MNNLTGNISSPQTLSGDLKIQVAASPIISVGTTETLPAGSNATVELDAASTGLNPIFNFGIPKGDDYVVTEEDLNEIETNIIEEIQPIVNEAKEKSETAISISKGANQSLGYSNYETMITAFNNLPIDTYTIGQSIYIVTLNVPDLWISSIEEENVPYTYIDDDTFVNELKTNGIVKVGHYVLSQLETQKVDLTNYVKNTDYGSTNKAGVVRGGTSYGTYIRNDGIVQIARASNDDIDEGTSAFKPIVPVNLNYAVGSVLPVITQAEYDELVANGTVNENLYYCIVEEE